LECWRGDGTFAQSARDGFEDVHMNQSEIYKETNGILLLCYIRSGDICRYQGTPILCLADSAIYAAIALKSISFMCSGTPRCHRKLDSQQRRRNNTVVSFRLVSVLNQSFPQAHLLKPLLLSSTIPKIYLLDARVVHISHLHRLG
jgi:hypothetical protein